MLLEMGRVVQLFSLYMVSHFLTKTEPTEMIVHNVQCVQSNLSQAVCPTKRARFIRANINTLRNRLFLPVLVMTYMYTFRAKDRYWQSLTANKRGMFLLKFRRR